MKPYDWFTNVPDPSGPDMADVLAWLKAHGAPDPQFVKIPLLPAADLKLPLDPLQLKYLTPDGSTLLLDAALVLNSPSAAYLDLRRAFNLPGPEYVSYSPPVKPVINVPPAVPRPDDPVGEYMGRNKLYYSKPGDDAPAGTIFKRGTEVFIKHLDDSPWGKYRYWEKA